MASQVFDQAGWIRLADDEEPGLRDRTLAVGEHGQRADRQFLTLSVEANNRVLADDQVDAQLQPGLRQRKAFGVGGFHRAVELLLQERRQTVVIALGIAGYTFAGQRSRQGVHHHDAQRRGSPRLAVRTVFSRACGSARRPQRDRCQDHPAASRLWLSDIV